MKPWHEVSFRQHGGQSSTSLSSLPLKSAILIPIHNAKYDDVLFLLPYVAPMYDTFYTNIPFAYDQDNDRG
jgi:hypothetical protein